jgi:O-antigen/teichoic acid export membrane protein
MQTAWPFFDLEKEMMNSLKFNRKFLLDAIFASGGEHAAITRGSISSFLIQSSFAALSFISAVVLARLLGTENYGAYANAMAWVGVFGVIASFGFGSLLVRDVAILRSQSKWAELKGFLRYSNGFVLGFSLLLSLMVMIIAWGIYSSPDKEIMRVSLWCASFLIPLTALATLKQSAIRGFENIVQSILPDMIIRPILILVGVYVIKFFFPFQLNAFSAVLMSVFAALITFCLSSYWLNCLLPSEIIQSKATYAVKTWMNSAFPMLVFVGLQILISQTSIVMLGMQKSAEDVGIFSVALRIATFLTFFIAAIHTVIGPIMARLYANGEKQRLQDILTITVRVSFLATALLGLLILFGSDFILSIFGQEFLAAKVALGILVFGNLADIATGSPALLLVMTGHEREVAIVYVIFAVINIILNGILISSYGYEGAALASVISVVVSRAILAAYSLNKLKLNPTVFSHSRLKIS